MHSIFKVENYRNVSFKINARYAVLGTLDKSTKSILYVFHGQGHLAKHFIKKFEILPENSITVIAPEGLHQYYLQGLSGRVGASWMTSENRLLAIENYIAYLHALHKDVLTQVSQDINIHLLGFSQGAATVGRWIEQSKFNFEQLILWGGALPPDLDKNLFRNRMYEKSFLQVIGKGDPYINSDKIDEIKILNEKYKLTPKFNFHEGGHDIIPSVLEKIFNHV